MKKKLKRPYVQPTADAVELETCQPLLANTGGAALGGYGDAIGEGESGGWQNAPEL